MKINRKIALFVFIFILVNTFVGHVPTTSAKSPDRATVNITVKNTNGYTISDVKVTMTTETSPYIVTVKTDTYGVASFPNAPVGNYSIEASSSGYNNVVPLTGSLTSGQTLDHTFNLTWNNSLGFYNFNANNNSLNTSSFEGSVSWSTYGTIPNALEMRVQFLDDANIPVGTTITSKYSVAETSYYNFNMSSTTIPTSATRIGVMLYDANNQLIDMKSSQIWVYSSHAARSLKFYDNNSTGGVLEPVVTWTGATDENTISSYKIYTWAKGGNFKYWDTVNKQVGGTYQYTFDDWSLNTAAILIGSVNSQGEELNVYPTMYVIDNRQGDTEFNTEYSASLPVPTNIQDYTYITNNKISGQIGFTVPADITQINGYTLYFANAAGQKVQALGTIYSPSNAQVIFYNFNDPLSIPLHATQFALYTYGNDGKESSVPVLIPINSLPLMVTADQLPQNLRFIDLDDVQGLVHGKLTWDRAEDESNLANYEIYLLNNDDQIIMTLGEVSKNDLPAFMLQRFSGVTKIGIGIKDTNGRKSVNTINIPISDHVSQEEILESAWEIRTTYFPEVSQIDLTHIVSIMQPTGASYFNQKEVQLFLSLIDPIIELD